jgi:sulfur carrier protein
MATLTVNGKPLEIQSAITVTAFLVAREIDAKHVAVARNGEVIDRDAYAQTILHGGDVVEIVRMVGGG